MTNVVSDWQAGLKKVASISFRLKSPLSSSCAPHHLCDSVRIVGFECLSWIRTRKHGTYQFCGTESSCFQRKNIWLPRNAVLQLFLSKFLNVFWGPGMDSNSFRPFSHLSSLQGLDCQHSKRDECVDPTGRGSCNWKPSSFGFGRRLRLAPASATGKCAGYPAPL